MGVASADPQLLPCYGAAFVLVGTHTHSESIQGTELSKLVSQSTMVLWSGRWRITKSGASRDNDTRCGEGEDLCFEGQALSFEGYVLSCEGGRTDIFSHWLFLLFSSSFLPPTHARIYILHSVYNIVLSFLLLSTKDAENWLLDFTKYCRLVRLVEDGHILTVFIIAMTDKAGRWWMD